MDLVTPDPTIIYQSLIEIPCRAFFIYHDTITGEWYASHPDEDRYDDDIIIQDEKNSFMEMELFDGYKLTKEEFDKWQEMVKEIII